MEDPTKPQSGVRAEQAGVQAEAQRTYNQSFFCEGSSQVSLSITQLLFEGPVLRAILRRLEQSVAASRRASLEKFVQIP